MPTPGEGSTTDASEIMREQSESVAAANLKVVGDGPAFYSNLAYANAVTNQQGLNAIHSALVGKIAESIIATSPSEGGADIAAMQQLIKAAQTTPPVTP